MKHLAKKFRQYWVEDISFITLLGILIFTIFIMPTLIELGWVGLPMLNITFSAIFFVGIWSALNKRWIVINSILFTTYLLIKFIQFSTDTAENKDYPISENFVAGLNILSFIYMNITLLFRDKESNFHRVIGSVNVFLLIGLLGAFLFEMIHQLFGSSISVDNLSGNGHKDFSAYIYFSLASITTVGFGDIVAVHPAARMLATFLSATGMLFPAVIIARLVSLAK